VLGWSISSGWGGSYLRRLCRGERGWGSRAAGWTARAVRRSGFEHDDLTLARQLPRLALLGRRLG
jgi:hypothetical protein